MANTKERIVDTAVELFNQSGTAAVSTNHIASAMGISPGNLYYHFGNKDEIVAAAFDRLERALDAVWEGGTHGDLAAVDPIVMKTMSVLREYRFIARELFALGVHSPRLRDRSRAVLERFVQRMRSIVDACVAEGMLRDPGGMEACRRLAEALAIALISYVPEVELRDPTVDSARIIEGVERVALLLVPYQTEPVSWRPGYYHGAIAHA